MPTLDRRTASSHWMRLRMKLWLVLNGLLVLSRLLRGPLPPEIEIIQFSGICKPAIKPQLHPKQRDINY